MQATAVQATAVQATQAVRPQVVGTAVQAASAPGRVGAGRPIPRPTHRSQQEPERTMAPGHRAAAATARAARAREPRRPPPDPPDPPDPPGPPDPPDPLAAGPSSPTMRALVPHEAESSRTLGTNPLMSRHAPGESSPHPARSGKPPHGPARHHAKAPRAAVTAPPRCQPWRAAEPVPASRMLWSTSGSVVFSPRRFGLPAPW